MWIESPIERNCSYKLNQRLSMVCIRMMSGEMRSHQLPTLSTTILTGLESYSCEHGGRSVKVELVWEASRGRRRWLRFFSRLNKNMKLGLTHSIILPPYLWYGNFFLYPHILLLHPQKQVIKSNLSFPSSILLPLITSILSSTSIPSSSSTSTLKISQVFNNTNEKFIIM